MAHTAIALVVHNSRRCLHLCCAVIWFHSREAHLISSAFPCLSVICYYAVSLLYIIVSKLVSTHAVWRTAEWKLRHLSFAKKGSLYKAAAFGWLRGNLFYFAFTSLLRDGEIKVTLQNRGYIISARPSAKNAFWNLSAKTHVGLLSTVKMSKYSTICVFMMQNSLKKCLNKSTCLIIFLITKNIRKRYPYARPQFCYGRIHKFA